jgi:hypothetical protein
MRLYDAESIINWRTDRIDGAEMLTLVVLEEEYQNLRGRVQARVQDAMAGT